MTQWVQHISGQGEKWKVIEVLAVQWVVEQGRTIRHSVLPKVEYVTCEPPEEVEDVTARYKFVDGAESVSLLRYEQFKYIDGMHNGPAFIIERKKG